MELNRGHRPIREHLDERATRELACCYTPDLAKPVGRSHLSDLKSERLAALKRHREGVFDPAVAAHNGRVVKLIGDGTIVEFASVIDAVNCALSVQRSGAPAPRAAQPAIVLRIGINLGDVIMEGEDIYGDGVNIAARREPLADPGGICISSIVNESIGNRIDVRFQDGGEITVKNIDRPIRIWRWQPASAAANSRQANAASSASRVATASIAVLPFTNMSGDAEQEYFSDGISEDIITLSQWLFGGLAEAELPVICVETRHMQAVLKAQINKTDRNDARGIAQMMRVGLYRPVHVKTLCSQKMRMLLTRRKLLQSKAIAIENDLRGTLRNFGLKVGMVG